MVASVPGYHSGVARTQWGHMAVREALRAHRCFDVRFVDPSPSLLLQVRQLFGGIESQIGNSTLSSSFWCTRQPLGKLLRWHIHHNPTPTQDRARPMATQPQPKTVLVPWNVPLVRCSAVHSSHTHCVCPSHLRLISSAPRSLAAVLVPGLHFPRLAHWGIRRIPLSWQCGGSGANTQHWERLCSRETR